MKYLGLVVVLATFCSGAFAFHLAGLNRLEERVESHLPGLWLVPVSDYQRIGSEFNQKEREQYQRMLCWDLLYPAVYVAVIVWSFLAFTEVPRWWMILPIVGGIADWIENGLVLYWLSGIAAEQNAGFAAVIAVATLLKSASLVASVVLLAARADLRRRPTEAEVTD